ncbi:FMN reductase [Psychromonas marina]|uniref:FMN reductase n=1 Tax=Psychromonas marina TaxID=88364 RepID=A0ABQ6E379_9GAMM|nr:NAD(P)H-dependent oxidoreductase [Psychromonas marina]GLS91863.1 FMN reductase [Psychromonas marina]
MKLLIISASHRKNSQTAKAAKFIEHNQQPFKQVTHIDLCELNLPFWDAECDFKNTNSAWLTLTAQMHAADAFILMTPEWAGTASPLLKNLLLMSDLDETAHKPVMLVGTSSGINGAYPVAELRMNGLKNTKLITVPDYLVIRNIGEILNDPTATSEQDKNMRERIDYCLLMLNHYAQAQQPVRAAYWQQDKHSQQRFAYGM